MLLCVVVVVVVQVEVRVYVHAYLVSLPLVLWCIVTRPIFLVLFDSVAYHFVFHCIPLLFSMHLRFFNAPPRRPTSCRRHHILLQLAPAPTKRLCRHTDPRESMVRTSSRRAAVRRTSGRVGAKVVEEKKEKHSSGRPKRSTRGKSRKSEDSGTGKKSSQDKANASQDKEESGDESDKGIDDQKDGSADDNVDLSIEYSLKLLKVGAEVYIRDTPNSSIRCKELIGKKGTIRKVDGAVGKASTWYLVDIPGAKDNAGEKKRGGSGGLLPFLCNSLVPVSLEGSPRNFMPDSEVKAIARRGRRSRKTDEKGRIPLDKVPKKDWIGKQIVFAAGRYEGENAWVLGHGSGLVHLIMGDDEPSSPPIIVSRMSKQLVAVPEENEEIEEFDPNEYVGKEGRLTRMPRFIRCLVH